MNRERLILAVLKYSIVGAAIATVIALMLGGSRWIALALVAVMIVLMLVLIWSPQDQYARAAETLIAEYKRSKRLPYAYIFEFLNLKGVDVRREGGGVEIQVHDPIPTELKLERSRSFADSRILYVMLERITDQVGESKDAELAEDLRIYAEEDEKSIAEYLRDELHETFSRSLPLHSMQIHARVEDGEVHCVFVFLELEDNGGEDISDELVRLKKVTTVHIDPIVGLHTRAQIVRRLVSDTNYSKEEIQDALKLKGRLPMWNPLRIRYYYLLYRIRKFKWQIRKFSSYFKPAR